MTRNTRVGGATAGYDTYAAVTPGPNPRPIPHAVSAAGDYVLAYDQAGNQISKTSPLSSHVLAWDAENKLAQVTIGAAIYKYLYGADHARVLKVVPQSSGPDKVTVYLGPDTEINDTGIWTKYLKAYSAAFSGKSSSPAQRGSSNSTPSANKSSKSSSPAAADTPDAAGPSNK